MMQQLGIIACYVCLRGLKETVRNANAASSYTTVSSDRDTWDTGATQSSVTQHELLLHHRPCFVEISATPIISVETCLRIVRPTERERAVAHRTKGHIRIRLSHGD